MSCWCDEVQDYKCFDCEKDRVWDKYNQTQKMKLKSYQRILEAKKFNVTNKAHIALQKYVAENNLDIASIPNS